MGHRGKKGKKNKRSASQAELDNEMSSNNQENDVEENTHKVHKKKKRDKNPSMESGEQQHGDNKISKRQMKREKHAQRMAESQEASHKSVRLQALSYLSLWKHNKAEWKFNKVKQIYLYKHKFDSDEVPDDMWKDFIEYFSSASGGIKKLIIEDSKKVIDEMDQWMEKNAEAENPKDKPSEMSYKRARDLIQRIQE